MPNKKSIFKKRNYWIIVALLAITAAIAAGWALPIILGTAATGATVGAMLVAAGIGGIAGAATVFGIAILGFALICGLTYLGFRISDKIRDRRARKAYTQLESGTEEPDVDFNKGLQRLEDSIKPEGYPSDAIKLATDTVRSDGSTPEQIIAALKSLQTLVEQAHEGAYEPAKKAIQLAFAKAATTEGGIAANIDEAANALGGALITKNVITHETLNAMFDSEAVTSNPPTTDLSDQSDTFSEEGSESTYESGSFEQSSDTPPSDLSDSTESEPQPPTDDTDIMTTIGRFVNGLPRRISDGEISTDLSEHPGQLDVIPITYILEPTSIPIPEIAYADGGFQTTNSCTWQSALAAYVMLHNLTAIEALLTAGEAGQTTDAIAAMLAQTVKLANATATNLGETECIETMFERVTNPDSDPSKPTPRMIGKLLERREVMEIDRLEEQFESTDASKFQALLVTGASTRAGFINGHTVAIIKLPNGKAVLLDSHGPTGIRKGRAIIYDSTLDAVNAFSDISRISLEILTYQKDAELTFITQDPTTDHQYTFNPEGEKWQAFEKEIYSEKGKSILEYDIRQTDGNDALQASLAAYVILHNLDAITTIIDNSSTNTTTLVASMLALTGILGTEIANARGGITSIPETRAIMGEKIANDELIEMISDRETQIASLASDEDTSCKALLVKGRITGNEFLSNHTVAIIPIADGRAILIDPMMKTSRVGEVIMYDSVEHALDAFMPYKTEAVDFEAHVITYQKAPDDSLKFIEDSGGLDMGKWEQFTSLMTSSLETHGVGDPGTTPLELEPRVGTAQPPSSPTSEERETDRQIADDEPTTTYYTNPGD